MRSVKCNVMWLDSREECVLMIEAFEAALIAAKATEDRFRANKYQEFLCVVEEIQDQLTKVKEVMQS